ncbi:MAG: hypothetical protein GY950_25435 [bacterium]|nr:hypothetical protein [bacterium]
MINKTLFIMLLAVSFVLPLPGNTPGNEENTAGTALIPGDINQISLYTDFFYNLPSEDFFYLLNDPLLFLEKPEGKLVGSGVRNKLLKIVRWHNVIRKSLKRFKKDKNKMVTINVSEPQGFKKASILLNMLGLQMVKKPDGKFRVTLNPALGHTHYFRFSMLKPKTIERQLNKANYFYFKLKESRITLPWDFGFLREVTGLKLNGDSFFETMLKDERFSLFLGLLYRLSDSEIQYISGLKDPENDAPRAAWQKIYNDKSFLMGMFVLADALRVIPGGAGQETGGMQWVFPGGKEAEPFWNGLTGQNSRKSPLEFLHQLAVKDKGKLNYLYLFAHFLPGETQKLLFTGPNAKKMFTLYQQIGLTEKEKLKETQFPAIRNFNMITLFYSLHMKESRFHFPQGVAPWLKLIKPLDEDESAETGTQAQPNETGKATKDYLSYAPSNARKKAFLSRKRSGIYVKVFGGIDFLNGGDFNTLIDTNEPFYRELYNPSKTRKAPFFWSLGGEIGYTIGKFSVGFEYARITRDYKIQSPLNYLETNHGEQTHRFSARALLFNLHFKVLDTRALSAYISGGGGIYYGTYNGHLGYVLRSNPNLPTSTNEDVSQKSTGFHVGAVVDFYLSKKFAFSAAARYRAVNFNDMYGEGSLSFFEEHHGSRAIYEGDLMFDDGSENRPAGFYVSEELISFPAEELRKARLNLTGLEITFGLKLYL